MPLNTMEQLLEWVRGLNESVHVSIHKNRLEDSDFWFYDKEAGVIRSRNNSFFTVSGLRMVKDGRTVLEQPIIIQDEIGYLGIICRDFDGETHYLMQAKIEPGNINKIQISPTIQATKSNFTQKHGGKKPAYLDYFINASKYEIIVDQIQSEQSSRFLKKRNRNIVIRVDEEIEVLPSHRWMTLNQIKELMRYDNLVNMDTRTVLSCLPVFKSEYLSRMDKPEMRNSAMAEIKNLPDIYQYINNYKMFDSGRAELVPLMELDNWHMKNNELVCDKPYSFKVVFCDIEIEGREVRHWTQPLFEATGIATFGLIMRIKNGMYEFLVCARHEVGCFDGIELGPTVQREYIHSGVDTEIDRLFFDKLNKKDGVIFDTLLSEEGGRFYHEQNRNVVLEIAEDEIQSLPEGYFWTNLRTLSELVQVNNCLNIQLRNLLSVLEW